MIRILAVLCAALFAAPASAYWEYGHQTIAAIAWQSMRPETRTRIEPLLRQGWRLETPTCPIRTIEQASVWADCIKPLGDRFSHAASWHYQNVHICRPFDLAAACKDGNCVSAQIERHARLLADRQLPVRERVQALAFLTHLVGDLANPMHGGDRGDRGGNDVRANYGLIGGRTNLHSIWDGWLAERAITSPPAATAGTRNDLPMRARARAMIGEVPSAERRSLASGTVEDWSRQSWEAARTLAYASLLGDPCGPLPKERPTLTEQDVQELIAPVRRQVLAGGLRLARLLDEALVEGKAPPRRRD